VKRINVIFIRVAVLAILLLLIFFIIIPHFKNKKEKTGGSFDRTNHLAPKTITSKDINSFEYAFSIYDANHRFGRDTIYNYCTFNLEVEGDEVRCIGSGYGKGSDDSFSFDFLTSKTTLESLQSILDQYQVASVNGINRGAIGIPQDLGASIRVTYASGERINASDNRGALLSDEANAKIYDFFINLAKKENDTFIETGDVDWDLYNFLQNKLESKDKKRTLVFQERDVLVYEGNELWGQSEYGIALGDDFIQLIPKDNSLRPYLFFNWSDNRLFSEEVDGKTTEYFPVNKN